eukprot:633156-Amphidinium_carterae.2
MLGTAVSGCQDFLDKISVRCADGVRISSSGQGRLIKNHTDAKQVAASLHAEQQPAADGSAPPASLRPPTADGSAPPASVRPPTADGSSSCQRSKSRTLLEVGRV